MPAEGGESDDAESTAEHHHLNHASGTGGKEVVEKELALLQQVCVLKVLRKVCVECE